MIMMFIAALSGAAHAGDWDCGSNSIGQVTCNSKSSPEDGYTIKAGDGKSRVWKTNDGDTGTAKNNKEAHKAARAAIEENDKDSQ